MHKTVKVFYSANRKTPNVHPFEAIKATINMYTIIFKYQLNSDYNLVIVLVELGTEPVAIQLKYVELYNV